MISAQQLKQALDYSFLSGINTTIPSISLNVTPATYTTEAPPSSLSFTGLIIPNDAISFTWALYNANTNTLLATGSTSTIDFTLNTPPLTVGNTIFNLVLTYNTANLTNITTTVSTAILVTLAAKYGQLAEPGDNILASTDLTNEILGTFSNISQNTLANLFTVVLSGSGRLVFVIPDSYGTVSMISDNQNTNITNNFNVVTDLVNARKIYVSFAPITAGTYYYQFTF
jgi:hypothetical protein